MGRYIGWQDVVGRYPDAAKIAGAEQVSSSWLTQAEYEVDARLAVRYATPFVSTPAPVLVQDLCIDLTYYKATIRQKGSEKIYEYLKDRFAAIVAGTIVVPGAVAVTGGAMTAAPTFQTAFGYDDAENWRPAADDIENTEARRE